MQHTGETTALAAGGTNRGREAVASSPKGGDDVTEATEEKPRPGLEFGWHLLARSGKRPSSRLIETALAVAGFLASPFLGPHWVPKRAVSFANKKPILLRAGALLFGKRNTVLLASRRRTRLLFLVEETSLSL